MGLSGNRSRVGADAFLGTFAASALLQGFTVVQGIILARILGPTGRGEFATVILWPNVFSAIGIFGTNIALARAAARVEDHDSLTRTSIFLAFITAAIASVACYLALPYFLPGGEQHLLGLSRFFVVFILLNHLILNINAVDQGAAHFKRFNLTRLLLNPVYCIFLVILWIIGLEDIKWVAASLLLATLVTVVVRLSMTLKNVKLWGKLHSPIHAFHESARFGLAGMATSLYFQIDKALILWMLDPLNLGFYTVALSASTAIGSVTTSAGMVSFTIAAQENKGAGFDKIARAFRISAILWLLGGTLLALSMGILLPLVYGSDFAPAVNSARLLIIGSALAGLANLLEQSIRGQGKAFVGLEGRVYGLIVMAVAGFFMIRGFGLTGGCLAYAFCQSTFLSVIIRRTNQHYSINTFSGYIPRWSDVGRLLRLLH